MKIRTSRAFREGFADGFTSMFSFATPKRRFVTYRHHDTVAESWREVGKLLSDSARKEGVRLDKKNSSREARIAH